MAKATQTTAPAHTPGPWYLDKYGNSIQAKLSSGMEVQVTAMFPTTFSGKILADEEREFASQNKANARLIAAAPELLAACDRALAHISTFGGGSNANKVIQQLGAVIDKAEGRS